MSTITITIESLGPHTARLGRSETRSLHVTEHRPFPDAERGKERGFRPLATEAPRALPGAHSPKHHLEPSL